MISNCKNQKKKSTNWFILIYEESVNKDYQETLKSLGIRCAISPVHDSDLGEDGSPLKPHRHILVTFNGGRRVQDIDSIIESINAYQHCEVVYDKMLSWQYLVHANNPEKHQYDKKDIVYINCTEYDFMSTPFKDILNYIDDNNLMSLRSLTRRLRDDNNDKLLEYVSSNCYYIQAYLKDALADKERALNSLYVQLTSLIADYNLEGAISAKAVQKCMELFGDVEITEL